MMSLFERLFGGKKEAIEQPDIRFGRYSDSYKDAANYDEWDKALEKFEQKAYLDSYRSFFKYLRDESEDNVRFSDENGGINFEMYQGSKKITGFADEKKLKAVAKIAKTQDLNVGFMRRLVEKNFILKYSRFALDKEGNICILFDSYTHDGSPYKLYYALKELATNADKQDDLLLDEFKLLTPVEVSHLKPLPDSQKEVKYEYLKEEIQSTLKEFENSKLDKSKYPGGMAYLLLHLVYKLDYLLKPEGYVMEALEHIHRTYFINDGKTTSQKNRFIFKQFKKLAERPKAEIFKELYQGRYTFGITSPVNHDRLVAFIDGELKNMDWYMDNGHEKIAMSIPNYIVGYCLFDFAVPKPDREFLHLYFLITESDYFKKLGFTYHYYNTETKTLNKKAVKRAIESIVERNKKIYKKVHPDISKINFNSIPEFAKSYLLMMRELDMTKSES